MSVNGHEAAEYFRREQRTNLAEARALIDLALEAIEEAEKDEFAADVIEGIEDLPDTPPETGEDGPRRARR